ncbi:MAG: DUF3224 domain-containing protein [Candidatus Dormibacteraeota bacterium]|nr:DUF3224 domain-containing protein [Candidatus Dormibacteraeota bacterium]
MHASGTFDIDSWEERPWDEGEGARLTRVRVTKTFHGDFECVSTAELLMAVAQVETSRAYVGFERVAGRVQGRLGSFVLHHNAFASAAAGEARWLVLPDSGTGELHGIRGEARIDIDPDGTHRFTLDYDLP